MSSGDWRLRKKSVNNMMPSREVVYNQNSKFKPRKRVRNQEVIVFDKTKHRKWKVAITAFFTLLSAVGLTCHVYDTTETFLKYEILSSIKVEVEEHLRVPQLSLCFGYPSMVNWTRAAEKHPDKPNIKSSSRITGDLHLTLGDLKDFTPDPEILLSQCRIRVRKNYLTQRYHREQCLEWFKIDKFFRLGFVCYRMQLTKIPPDSEPVFSHHHVRHSFVSPGMMFELFLNEKELPPINFFYIITFVSGWFPESETTFMVHASRSDYVFSLFYISYDVKITHLLKPPFPSSCRVYHEDSEEITSKDVCLHKCMAETSVKRFRTLPLETTLTNYTVSRPEMNNMTFFTLGIFENSTFIKQFNAMERGCKEHCRFPDCTTMYYHTRLLTKERNEKFTVRLYTPVEFNLITRETPEQTLAEYLNSLFSFLSIWFGISFLGTGFSILDYISTKKFFASKTSRVKPS